MFVKSNSIQHNNM